VVGSLVGLVAAPAVANDSGFASTSRSGPALSVPRDVLGAALTCTGDFRGSTRKPVLLIPGTSVTPEQNYSWNWEQYFAAQKRPWCTVASPYRSLGDIQTSGEYIVYAIRRMHAMAGRKIAVMGHSQGGMSMRWALRFWPDTRTKVDDVVSFAADNHGTTVLDPICVQGLTTCTPQGWQQRSKARFIRALNSRAETFAGISYTQIYTRTDEVVMPSTGPTPSSALTTGAGRITNVATQDVCPLDVYEHVLLGTVDPVAHALAVDALDHDGPAKRGRINPAVCSKTFMPGIDPLDVENDVRSLTMVMAIPNMVLVTAPFVNLLGAPQLVREPALRCYVYAAGC
jgi:pimeloyl-ACP methyl ester carboxylesterase